MTQRNTGVILLVLLLAATVMVPMVSAIDNLRSLSDGKELIESNYISVDLAREHATITMLSMIQSGALDSNWDGATINPTPKEIYDVNGERLFYLFSVEKGGRVGEIYAAASKVLGGSVIAIGSINEPDTFEKLQKFSQDAIKEKYSGYQIVSEETVSFDFPVLGSMITLKNEKTGESKKVIIDSRDGSEKKIDTQVSSYYGQIPAEVKKQNVAILEPSKTQVKALRLQDGQKIITGLTHYTQYTDVWCAVATAQIISSKYMSPPWGQYHIADMMGAYYPDDTPKGTTPGDELDYYTASVANGGLGKGNSYDIYRTYTTWQAAHDEIENNRPLKIGRDSPSYHSRACNGWLVNAGNTYLLFYDPAQYGSIYWELVGPSDTYNNFVYVQ